MTEPDPVVRVGTEGFPRSAGAARRSNLIWVSVLVFPLGALAVFLFMNPRWGERLDVSMSTLLGVTGILATVLIGRGSGPFEPGSRLDTTVPAGTAFPRRTRLLIIGLVFALTFGTVVTIYVTRREPDPDDRMSGHVRIGYVASDQGGLSVPDLSSDTQVGFEAALVNALMDRFPRMEQPEWVPLNTYEDRISALRGRWGDDQEPVDLVVSSFSITDQRRRLIDFAGPYFRDSQALVTTTPAAQDPLSVSFNRVCTPDGTTGQRRLKVYGWSPRAAESLQKCFALLEQKEVNAVSTDSVILQSYRSQHPIPGANIRYPFLGSSEKYGIGLPNNSPRLCEEISDALTEFLETSWNAAYDLYLVPRGLTTAELPDHKPRSVDSCETPGSWFSR